MIWPCSGTSFEPNTNRQAAHSVTTEPVEPLKSIHSHSCSCPKSMSVCCTQVLSGANEILSAKPPVILPWIQWNLPFRYIHCIGQFTPKMKANAVPRLLSSLVWIDQYNECNGMASFMEFKPCWIIHRRIMAKPNLVYNFCLWRKKREIRLIISWKEEVSSWVTNLTCGL